MTCTDKLQQETSSKVKPIVTIVPCFHQLKEKKNLNVIYMYL